MKKKADQKKDKPKKSIKRRKKVKPKKLIGMEMEQVYTLINLAQIKRIEQEIIIESISSPMLENILKDCQIEFSKTEKEDGYHYIIQPPPERKMSDEAFIFSEEMEDEIPEDGEENMCFDDDDD